MSLAADDASPVTLKKQKPAKATDKDSEKKTAKSSKAAQSTKKAKAAEEEPVVETTNESPDVEEVGEDKVQELALLVDSDDDVADDASLFKPGMDVGEVPKHVKENKKDSQAFKHEPGVIYVGRIPHGFYEYEMRQYFSQFGPITKLRLSRNKKTGASKHFAFVEFAEASTADIVSKTMNNYLLFGHILKCKIIPKEQVHEDLFKGANRRFKQVPWNKMAGKQLQKPHSQSAWAKKLSREQQKRAKQASKLEALGYEFEAPQFKEIPTPAPVEKEEETEVKQIEAPPADSNEEKAIGKTDADEEIVDGKPNLQEPGVQDEPAATTKSKMQKSKSAKMKKSKVSKA